MVKKSFDLSIFLGQMNSHSVLDCFCHDEDADGYWNTDIDDE